jgi:hypothetical protein
MDGLRQAPGAGRGQAIIPVPQTGFPYYGRAGERAVHSAFARGVFVTQGDWDVVTASFGLVSLLTVWDYREYIGVFVRFLACHEGRVHSSCVAIHVQAMTYCLL